ncbi:MAG: PEGA domain-containing protein [Deltaproteobacteria bacterium]|nr:PEGA domain-containing protein [Deltaproteobacteria bacterium]
MRLAFLVIVVSSLASAARADRPRLLLVRPADPALARSLSSALAARATIVGPERLEAASSDAEPARRASEAIQQAETLYGDGRPDEALEVIRAALARDARALAEAADVSLLARLRLWEGICLAKSGREADARAALLAARSLGSGPPDPLRFPPDVQALFPGPAPPLPTEIVTNPAGAFIEVDGIPGRQRTPARIDLAPGDHVIRLRRAGHVPLALIVLAGERVEVPLERAAGPALGRALAGMRDAGVLDLDDLDTRGLIVGALGLDGRIDVQVEGRRVVLSRFDPRGHRVARSSGSPRDAEALVGALFGDDGPRRPPAGGSIFGRWWFWTAVGAVAVTGAVVGIAVATAEEDTISYVPVD